MLEGKKSFNDINNSFVHIDNSNYWYQQIRFSPIQPFYMGRIVDINNSNSW